VNYALDLDSVMVNHYAKCLR